MSASAARSELDVSYEEAAAELWRQGDLYWKLHRGQQDVSDAFHATDELIFTAHCGRQFGKSNWASVEAVQTAIQVPAARVCYCASHQKAVKEIIKPIIRMLSLDAPAAYKPRWYQQDQKYVIPATEGEICVAGADNDGVDKLRGPYCHLFIFDEAGYLKDDLEYAAKGVVMPMFATTHGRIIMASNSPKTSAHKFRHFCQVAEARGAYIRKTTHDNPRLSPGFIAKLCEEMGGPESTTWKREGLALWVTDEESAIIPEFTEQKALEIVREVERPRHYHSYVAMDVGFGDLTAVLFGYWDFLQATLVIEDEFVINRMTTEDLALGIRAKETELWGDKRPFRRISDVDLIVINDLAKLHGLQFAPTAKDNKEAAINAVRLMVRENKIAIHPRCKTLISHLKHGIWNNRRTDFERSADHGHFDAVDALVYLVRNLKKNHNPYPAMEGISKATHYVNPNAISSKTRHALVQAVGGGRRRR